MKLSHYSGALVALFATPAWGWDWGWSWSLVTVTPAPVTDIDPEAHAHTSECAGITKASDCPATCDFSGPNGNGLCADPAGTATVAATDCTSHTSETDCLADGDNLDCAWVGNGANAVCEDTTTAQTLSCADRGTQNANSCELDDQCMFTNNRGTKSCTDVNGIKAVGETCTTQLVQDGTTANPDGEPYWLEVEGCVGGAICTVTEAPIGIGLETPVEGTCQDTECIGKKVPGNCNGNIEKKDQCSSETSRVTICHRTCSEKNPWVRITIDEDAWDGEGCGHQQHDIRDECSKYGPDFTAWGPNRRDYLLVRHGTRDDVAAAVGNAANQKDYWRKWEPACPYVRRGHCCNFDITDPTDPDYSPCCGAAPEYACDFDMGETDETICPYGDDAVTVLSITSDNNQVIPSGMDPSKIFYDLYHGGTAVAPEVTFKVDNPFDFEVDTYIQYHKHPENSSQGALDPACIAEPSKAMCNPDEQSVTAGCIVPKNGEAPFSLVTVFFASSESLFGAGGTDVNPYECCEVPSLGSKKIIEYTFKVLCACPDHTADGRQLRASAVASDVELWQQQVGTGH